MFCGPLALLRSQTRLELPFGPHAFKRITSRLPCPDNWDFFGLPAFTEENFQFRNSTPQPSQVKPYLTHGGSSQGDRSLPWRYVRGEDQSHRLTLTPLVRPLSCCMGSPVLSLLTPPCAACSSGVPALCPQAHQSPPPETYTLTWSPPVLPVSTDCSCYSIAWPRNVASSSHLNSPE